MDTASMLADTTSSAAEACGLVTLTQAWLLPPVELEAPSTSATSTQGCCCVPLLLLEAEEGGSVDWGGAREGGREDGEAGASVRSHLASSQHSVCI